MSCVHILVNTKNRNLGNLFLFPRRQLLQILSRTNFQTYLNRSLFTGKGQKRQSRPWLSSPVFPMKSTVCNMMQIRLIQMVLNVVVFYAFSTYGGGPRRHRRSDPQLAQINREFRTADKSVGSLPSRPGKKENHFENNFDQRWNSSTAFSLGLKSSLLWLEFLSDFLLSFFLSTNAFYK